MKNIIRSYTILSLIILLLPLSLYSYKYAYNSHPPKLTVIIVIDQFAHHYINKLYPHLKGGLRYLLDNGVVFTNAFMPHGLPSTAPGHAALNTGTYAKDHGFISNSWLDGRGNKITCDFDDNPEAFVLDPTTDDDTFDYGKSPHYLMVDGLSDQCVMQSHPNSIFRSMSISGKSRSAIATAGHLGKAIWFNSDSGLFTSSKAYFQELPTWIKHFNKNNNCNERETFVWTRMYPKSPFAYNFFNTEDYAYTRPQETMLDRTLPVPDMSNEKNPYHLFERSPLANKLILDLGQACIKTNVSRKIKDRLVLYICLSPLDKLSHEYGPDSIEVIDMIYHIDQQLKKFIRFALKAVGKHQCVFVLSADHGVMPIPQILQEKGLMNAELIDHDAFIKDINNHVEHMFNISPAVLHHKGQELVLNKEITDTLDADELNDLRITIKNYVLSLPHVKNAWTYQELANTPTQPGTIEDNIKKQMFPGRSGDIILQLHPYNLSSHWSLGTSHKSPYDYDTHVPLILFHPGKFEKKYVRNRVTTLQLANTLAELLNVPKPSASTAEILPELFDPEYQ